MDQGLIPRRYAKALYQAAAGKDLQQQLYQQAKQLSQAFAAEPALGRTMANPFVSGADKKALLLSASGAEADSYMARFADLLLSNGRIDQAREAAQAYADIYRKANGIHRVEVVAAAPMGQAEEQRLRSIVQARLGKDTMEWSMRTDPELIGGFVVNIDNQRLDASVRNELKQLRLNLLSNK